MLSGDYSNLVRLSLPKRMQMFAGFLTVIQVFKNRVCKTDHLILSQQKEGNNQSTSTEPHGLSPDHNRRSFIHQLPEFRKGSR